MPIRRLRPDAILPQRAYSGDAGLDLSACEHVVLAPGERASVELRWLNWCGQPRETQLVRPVLDVRFSQATELRVRTGPMGPPRCDAPLAPSTLTVNQPLQPQ